MLFSSLSIVDATLVTPSERLQTLAVVEVPDLETAVPPARDQSDIEERPTEKLSLQRSPRDQSRITHHHTSYLSTAAVPHPWRVKGHACHSGGSVSFPEFKNLPSGVEVPHFYHLRR